MKTTSDTWRQFPRWLLEEHDLSSLFNSQLATGQATEVTQRIHDEPATLQALLDLLGDARTALSTRIGIGVVMEDFARTPLLQQQIPALGRLSEHPDASIRADACHYLGLSGDARAIPFLQARVDADTDREVRETAADALEQL
jgi:HEAT repeat protein